MSNKQILNKKYMSVWKIVKIHYNFMEKYKQANIFIYNLKEVILIYRHIYFIFNPDLNKFSILFNK